jgi:hypothetical protein
MSIKQCVTLLGTLTLPQLAFASGGDVLSLLWFEFLLFVFVAVSLLVLRASPQRKLAVFGVYLLSTTCALLLTSDWAYSDNQAKINALSVGLPFVAWLVALTLARRRQT